MKTSAASVSRTIRPEEPVQPSGVGRILPLIRETKDVWADVVADVAVVLMLVVAALVTGES